MVNFTAPQACQHSCCRLGAAVFRLCAVRAAQSLECDAAEPWQRLMPPSPQSTEVRAFIERFVTC